MLARKPAIERKAEIVAATLRLAVQLGPDRLTTQSVADAVGLTQPAIFRHFATKQDLWLAVAVTIAERLTSAWDNALQGTNEPQSRIEALILAQLHQIEAMPAIPSILFSRELQAENDALRETVLGLMIDLIGRLAHQIGLGQGAGVFDSAIAPRDAAQLLVALVQGLAIRWSLTKHGFNMQAEGQRLLAAQMRLLRPCDQRGTP